MQSWQVETQLEIDASIIMALEALQQAQISSTDECFKSGRFAVLQKHLLDANKFVIEAIEELNIAINERKNT